MKTSQKVLQEQRKLLHWNKRMKSRNFIGKKTGHHASDEYFEHHAALWYDSDMATAFVGGFIFGILIGWSLFSIY